MEPAGGVAQHHVDAPACAPRWTASKQTAAGSAPVLAAHDGRAHPLRPDLELLAGGGAEGVARAEQHRLPRPAELGGQLADGGRLARAVHPHHHDHPRAPGQGRTAIGRSRRGPAQRQDAGDLLAQRGLEARRDRRARAGGPAPARDSSRRVAVRTPMSAVNRTSSRSASTESSTGPAAGEERVEPGHEAAAGLLQPCRERAPGLGLRLPARFLLGRAAGLLRLAGAGLGLGRAPGPRPPRARAPCARVSSRSASFSGPVGLALALLLGLPLRGRQARGGRGRRGLLRAAAPAVRRAGEPSGPGPRPRGTAARPWPVRPGAGRGAAAGARSR